MTEVQSQEMMANLKNSPFACFHGSARGWCMKISPQNGHIKNLWDFTEAWILHFGWWKLIESHVFSPQVALATEIPDYNQMTLPLGGSHTATAAQMRHFCRSYEFQLPTQPSSLSPPLPPPSTVQFSTLGPGGRHVYCNIPMTLLNGQVGDQKGQGVFIFFLFFLYLIRFWFSFLSLLVSVI